VEQYGVLCGNLFFGDGFRSRALGHLIISSRDQFHERVEGIATWGLLDEQVGAHNFWNGFLKNGKSYGFPSEWAKLTFGQLYFLITPPVNKSLPTPIITR
jgi:hypothetical protein